MASNPVSNVPDIAGKPCVRSTGRYTMLHSAPVLVFELQLDNWTQQQDVNGATSSQAK